jgi:HD-like signal output (HDOD) protein
LFYGDSYKKVIEEGRKQESALTGLEMDHYNVTHQDLGAYLLNWWELPFAYTEAAMFHHRPSDERVSNYELVAVVHLANYYSLKEIAQDGTLNYLDVRVFSELEIKKEDVEAVLELLD